MRLRVAIAWVVCTVLGALFFTPGVLAYAVPAYDGYVNDFAEVLSDEEEQQLESRLAATAQSEQGVEFALVTISSLEGEGVETVAQDFFDSWEIGKAGQDNGVLVLLAIQDRKIRIATGYGVEGSLPDAAAGRIIRDTMTPLLKDAKYYDAFDGAVSEILARVAAPELYTQADAQADSASQSGSEWMAFLFVPFLFPILGSLVAYAAAFLGRTTHWYTGGIIGGVLGLMLAGGFGLFLLGAIGLFLDYVLSKNYSKWKLQSRPTQWSKTWGGFSSSSSSSSSSGSSFGGGRSGGGGASGGW